MIGGDSSAHVQMAAVKALESSLVFCRHNFEQADERNAIMSVRKTGEDWGRLGKGPGIGCWILLWVDGAVLLDGVYGHIVTGRWR
jgi:hypothetical protein